MARSLTLNTFDLAAFSVGHKTWDEIVISGGLVGDVRLPIAIARGQEPGPTVLVVAGVHGDEFEGPTAIEKYFDELDAKSLTGSVVALPAANPYAFDAQTRESGVPYDGLNLARQFPGNAEGTPTQRLADSLFRFTTALLGPQDLFIDFHSGGTRYEFLSMVGYHPTDDATEEASLAMARVFGIDRVWKVPPSPSSTRTFNGTIARAGIPTLGMEMRGRGGLLAVDVDPLVAGLRNVLVAKGMLSGQTRSVSAESGTTTRTVNCGASGIFRSRVELSDLVSRDDVLAQIVLLTGKVEEEIAAPVDGKIWAIRRFASVRPGDIAFMIGME